MSNALLAAALLGCASQAPEVVQARADDVVASVIRVSWETEEALEGWVEYGTTEAYGEVTPVQPAATEQEVAILGLPADTRVHYRVVVRNGERVDRSEDFTVLTEPIPSELPPFEVEGTLPAESPGYTLFSWWSVVTGDSAVAIADAQGRIVWAWVPDQGLAQAARLSPTGDGVYVLCAEIGQDPDAYIAYLPLAGGELTTFSTPYAHHDFQVMGDGTLAWLAHEERDIDGARMLGDRLLERAPDGTETEVWNAFDDDWPMVENGGWAQDPIDWTHANGMTYIPELDAWAVSLYYDYTVIALARATGDVLWQFGGPESDFTTGEDSLPFGPQHAPYWRDGNLALFDNRYDASSSRLVEYHLDLSAWTAVRTWEYVPAEPMSVRLMGAMQRLPSGVASAWGELEEIRDTDNAGALQRRLYTDALGLVGRVDRFPLLYPADAPFP